MDTKLKTESVFLKFFVLLSCEAMKKLVARTLSKQFKQIDDFKSMCHLIKGSNDSNVNDTINKIKKFEYNQIGDDMIIEKKSKLFQRNETIYVTLIDSISRNHLTTIKKSIDELDCINIDELKLNHIHKNTKLIGKIINKRMSLS